MTSTTYKVNINCVVLSIDIATNKPYVLSLSKDHIEFPFFECNTDFLMNTNDYLVQFLKNNYIYLNDLELMPQIINLHSNTISDNSETINVIYGFITSKTKNISDKASWYAFDYQIPNPYSSLLFEVTQKLK